MNYEITLHVPTPARAFLQDGFFDHAPPSASLHRHDFGEIHLITDGGMDFEVAAGVLHLVAGEALFVPAGVYHRRISCDAALRHLAFQWEGALTGERCRIPAQLVREYFATAEQKSDSAALRAMLLYLISRFDQGQSVPLTPTPDRGFIIREFFDNHYHRNVTLEELAGLLSLSPKQTARIVEQYTGHTFRKEITAKRIEAASLLMQSGMSAREAALRVGYTSYSGFWKARRKY